MSLRPGPRHPGSEGYIVGLCGGVFCLNCGIVLESFKRSPRDNGSKIQHDLYAFVLMPDNPMLRIALCSTPFFFSRERCRVP